jgi:electron transfer flavoprotein beta subunit
VGLTDKAVRINRKATDSFQVASYIANYAKENSYDLIIAGRESIDYNGSMVPGMISEILNINFVTNCVGLEIQDGNAKAEREIEGGKETLSCKLPMIIGGQKGLVEESDLKIPNMRGIMQARQKPLESIEPPDLDVKTTTNKFYKPKEKKEIKMLDANDLDNLIDLLHNEAKVL